MTTDPHFAFSSLDAQPNLAIAFLSCADKHPDLVAYRYPSRDNHSSTNSNKKWTSTTRGEVKERIINLAHALHALGVRAGTTVAILSNTRPEWCEADIAIQYLGATTVSVYPSANTKELEFIVNDAQIQWFIVENQEQCDKILNLVSDSEGSSFAPLPAIMVILAVEAVLPHHLVQQYTDLVSRPASIRIPPSLLGRHDLASIVYTSGTTGVPKGVMQSHGNHLSNVRQAVQSGICTAVDEIFLFLPLAHSFARLMHYIGATTPAPLAFPSISDKQRSVIDLASVAQDLRTADSVFIPAVPRLFEKMREALLTRATQPSIAGALLRKCLSSAESYSRSIDNGTAPSLATTLWYQGLSPIRKSIKKALFGGRFAHAISGGAKLPFEVNRFFENLGIVILEGYGLTETCVATHVNVPNKRKLGTVGPALPDVETKFGPENEVWVRGPNVAMGYYHREDETKAVWDEEGWFHTGDIGSIDEEGFLTITGRLKELIITAGGKKVAPAMLETHFKRSPYISHLVPFGDGKPYLVALITLNRAIIEQTHSGLLTEFSEPELAGPLHDFVAEEIRKLNDELASFERIKRFAVLPIEFTTENELLTPTQKPKKNLITLRYSGLIDRLYR